MTSGGRCPRTRERRARPRLAGLERLLLVIGLVSLGYFGYVVAESYLYQALENRELDAILASAPARLRPTHAAARRVPRPAGRMIGRIEIPRLGVSAIIRAGSDARTLRLAVGHIPGTAFPGESGNIGLAGHRDTFFRRLRDIRVDDEIRIVTPDGTLTFTVERTSVVQAARYVGARRHRRAGADAGDLLSVHLRRLGAATVHRPREPTAEPASRRAKSALRQRVNIMRN